MAASRSSTRTSTWSKAAWLFGTILVLAIFLALGATIWRMDQTYNLADSDIATAEDYQTMIDTSLRWTRIGLGIGAPAAAFYIISLLLHLHHKNSAAKRELPPEDWD